MTYGAMKMREIAKEYEEAVNIAAEVAEKIIMKKYGVSFDSDEDYTTMKSAATGESLCWTCNSSEDGEYEVTTK